MKVRSLCLVALSLAWFAACGGSSTDSKQGNEGQAGSGGSSASGKGGAGTATGGGASTAGSSTVSTGGTSMGSGGTGSGQGGANAGTSGETGSNAGTGGASAGAAGENAGGTVGEAGASGQGGAALPMCKCGTENCGECPTISEVTPEGATYKIYATEVTNAEYAKFLAANPPTLNQPTECKWNGSFVPSNGWPATGKDDHPVVHVDWCDAYAFCAWTGRRLCGKIAGGANGYTDHADATKSQWFNACSSNAQNDYPYGDTYDPKKCNGSGYWDNVDDKKTVPVGSIATCVAGGAFDMSGNVWEWEDSCDASGGELDKCRARGGSFFTEEQELAEQYLRCRSATTSYSRSNSRSTLGFRCCE